MGCQTILVASYAFPTTTITGSPIQGRGRESEGELRPREKCVLSGCMHEYGWRRGVEREGRLIIEPLFDDHADCKLLVRIYIHNLSDWREFPA